MRSLRQRWSDVSVSGKLYLVVGIMAVLIAGELLTLRFAMRTLSSVRAFVGGESLWSKAEKNAVISLERYGRTLDERDYLQFFEHLKTNDGDHQARMELMKSEPDYGKVREGFLLGKIHPGDIEPMIQLLRRFHRVDYVARAIAAWVRGDELILELKQAGRDYREALVASPPDPGRTGRALRRVGEIDDQLSVIEEEFSNALGEGSRWLERIVFSLLLLGVITVEGIGLALTFFTGRSISRGLVELAGIAGRIGRGDFSVVARVRSRDEIGRLARAVNEMGALLQQSYQALESRVSERTAELSRAVKARDEFLSVASHELKTPLTALQMNLQLLGKLTQAFLDAPGQKDAELAAQIAGKSFLQTRRLTRLVDELLDLARLRSGKLHLNRQACDLVLLVREAIEDVTSIGQNTPKIAFEAVGQLVGEWDPIRIRQVVANLISNALKYGAGSPVSIAVLQEGETGVLRVRDQGVGIAPADQVRVFDAFERASEDTAVTGLGLGLYISRQIVQAHGGMISVSSQLAEGSMFQVTLPLRA